MDSFMQRTSDALNEKLRVEEKLAGVPKATSKKDLNHVISHYFDKNGPRTVRQICDYINGYEDGQGKIHRGVQVTRGQMTGILKEDPDFEIVETKKPRKWYFVGE